MGQLPKIMTVKGRKTKKLFQEVKVECKYECSAKTSYHRTGTRQIVSIAKLFRKVLSIVAGAGCITAPAAIAMLMTIILVLISKKFFAVAEPSVNVDGPTGS